ncbi:MAG: DUF4011 domain-containing protein [Acholeplasmatales bacterium]|nr:DUF4011 domain-containing protein [Acholeplasmatales bacterium]
MIYRVVYVKLMKKNKEEYDYPFLAGEKYSKGDKVILEGINSFQIVSKYVEFDDLTFPYNIDKIKKVIGRYIPLKIEITADVKKYFSYPIYHANRTILALDRESNFNFIDSITIKNLGTDDISNLVLSFDFIEDSFKVSDILISEMRSQTKMPIRNINLSADLDKYNVPEMRESSFKIKAILNGNIISEEAFNFIMLPLNTPTLEFLHDHRFYLKYVTDYKLNLKKSYDIKDFSDLYQALILERIKYHNYRFDIISDNLLPKVSLPCEIEDIKYGNNLSIAIYSLSVIRNYEYDGVILFDNENVYFGILTLSTYDIYTVERVKKAIDDNILLLVDGLSITISKPLNKALIKSDMLSDNIEVFRLNDYIDTPFNPIDIKLDTDINPEIEENQLDDFVSDRFTSWERKLLDLNEANPLVNFKLKDSNQVRLISGSKISDILKKYNQFKIKSFITPEDPSSFFKTSLDGYELTDEIQVIGFGKTLDFLIKKNKTQIEETGSESLYLTLGLIEYKNKKDVINNSPFLVLPINIVKSKSGEYTISYDYDEIMLNETVFEYYHTINPFTDFSNLYDLDLKLRYSEICDYIESYKLSDFKLERDIYLISNLTFSHYVMWKDMKLNRENLIKNRIIDSFINSKSKVENLDLSYDKPYTKYSDICAPLLYDSTQLDAIIRSANDHSFILDGPPGTGKSQTIVNMIVNAFYNNKTVLFVAEKKAALDVVYNRLKNVGLDKYALSLHSTDAKKGVFYKKISESFEIEDEKDNDFYDICMELDARRFELENILNKMHDKKYFYSLYDAICEYDLYEDKKDIIINDRYLLSLNDDKNKKVIDTLNNISVLSKTINNFDTSKIKALDIDEINFYDKNKFNKSFTDFDFATTRLYKDILNLYDEINLDLSLDLDNIFNLIALINHLYSHDLYFDLLKSSSLNSKELDDALEQVHSLYNFINTHNYYIFNKIINIDAVSIVDEINSANSFFKKLKVNKEYKKLLESLIKSDFTIGKNLIKYFEEIEEYNEIYNKVKEVEIFINKTLNIDILNNIKDVNFIIENIKNTRVLDSILSKFKVDLFELSQNIYNSRSQELKNLIIKLESSYNKEIEEINKINKEFKISFDVFKSMPDELDLIKSFIDDTLNTDFNDIISIAKINNYFKKLDEYDIHELSISIKNGNTKSNEIIEVYLKSLAKGYLRLYFDDDDINYFKPSIFNETIKRYKELIDEYSHLSILECENRIKKEIKEKLKTYDSIYPLSKLKKACQTSGKNLSIRNANLEYDEILKSFYRVYLMSPLSVSKYLSNKNQSKFDIVIFDEASQIPLHEAISSIGRGKSLIVSGDEMQMPPSNYFQGVVDDSVDSESLLSEAISIGLERSRLKFHYRSHHESLIEFSNREFYQDSLYTFPSNDINSSKIKLKYLDVKKNDSSLSQEEIDEIIKTIENIYKNPKTNKYSLGIIVFNVIEVEMLERAILKYLDSNPSIKDILDSVEKEKGEPLFIKSIENVQGDERDIIILSVGFKKNSLSHPFINGPLVRLNGEKRLNVAISRSKEMMYVISTIKYSDFESDDRITSNGAKILKKFLKYSEENSKPENLVIEDKTKLSKLINDELNNLGYKTEMSIGKSKFKVDIGIVSPQGDYALGILIDPDIDSASLRDNIYLKEDMLKKLGWKIITIYSLEYYMNKRGTIDKIISSIDNPFVEKVKEEVKVEIKKYDVRPYKNTILGKIEYDRRFGFKELDGYIDVIIKTEEPISLNRIKTIIRDKSNLKVLSTKMEEYIEIALLGRYFTMDQDMKFYWNKNSNFIDYFRLKGDREIYDISKEEIASAMTQILKSEELTKEELYKRVLEEFGFDLDIIDDRIKDRLEYVYKYAIDSNLL